VTAPQFVERVRSLYQRHGFPRGARPRGTSGGGVCTGLALLVPDCKRAGRSDGLAPGSEPLTRWGRRPTEQITRMGEVPTDHSGDRYIRRIELMKGLAAAGFRTAAAGLVGGFAGALLGATAFITVNLLLPSIAEAQWSNEAVVLAAPTSIHEG